MRKSSAKTRNGEKDAPETSLNAHIHAPFMGMRNLVRSMLTDAGARQLGDAYARAAPHTLQRLTERAFDFPISAHVRSSPLLLIRVPRSGSLSLSLRLYGRVSHTPHRTALFYRDSDPHLFAAIPSFGVVRNPWNRVQSAYAYLKGDGSTLSRPNPRTRKVIAGIKSFEHFVLDYLLPFSERLHRLDPTVHEQHPYLCDRSGQVLVNHVFRLEHRASLDAFLAESGVGGAGVHENRSRGPSPEPMRAELTEIVGRLYAKDAALFGYEPG